MFECAYNANLVDGLSTCHVDCSTDSSIDWLIDWLCFSLVTMYVITWNFYKPSPQPDVFEDIISLMRFSRLIKGAVQMSFRTNPVFTSFILISIILLSILFPLPFDNTLLWPIDLIVHRESAGKGIRYKAGKVKPLRFSAPTIIEAVQPFSRLASFYSRFIPKFTESCAPNWFDRNAPLSWAPPNSRLFRFSRIGFNQSRYCIVLTLAFL